MDPYGKEFKNPEKLFSIQSLLWDIQPNENGTLPTVLPIPVTNCTIYDNEPFIEDFDRLLRQYPTSKCIDFKNSKKNLYGKYASLLG